MFYAGIGVCSSKTLHEELCVLSATNNICSSNLGHSQICQSENGS